MDIDTESVQQEIRKHEALAGDVKKLLVKLSSALDNLEKEENVPSSLTETISIGRSLIKSLPKDIDERMKYLDGNKDLRLLYIKYVSEFNNWIHQVENQFVNDNDDIDFENIAQIMANHVSSVDNNLPNIKKLLEKINDTAKSILPSLNNINKEELMRDLQKYSNTLKDITERAAKSKENLQKNSDFWNSYCSLYNSIDALLGKVPKESSITTIGKLKEYLQKLNDKLAGIQVSLKTFL